jgi:enolase
MLSRKSGAGLPRPDNRERGSSAGSGDTGESNGGTVQIIGDDLFTADPQPVARGIVDNGSNVVLIKLNEIGALSETLDMIGRTVSNS